MELLCKKINIYFKNIFLQEIEIVPKKLEQIKSQCDDFNLKYRIQIPDINCVSEINLIIEDYCYGLDEINLDGLNKESKQIIMSCYFLDKITDSGSINYVRKEMSLHIFTNETLISDRIKESIMPLYESYKRNNYLVCFYMLRDIIEDIKYYYYFKYISENNTNFDNRNVIGNILWPENKIKFKFNEVLLDIKNQNLKKLLEEINRINILCDSYIHKNGFDKIRIKKNTQLFRIDYVFLTIKLFFLTLFYNDKKQFRTSWVYHLNPNEPVPKDLIYRIDPGIKQFINLFFSKEDIQNLKKDACYSDFNKHI